METAGVYKISTMPTQLNATKVFAPTPLLTYTPYDLEVQGSDYWYVESYYYGASTISQVPVTGGTVTTHSHSALGIESFSFKLFVMTTWLQLSSMEGRIRSRFQRSLLG